MKLFFGCLVSYLIGAVPTGYIAGRVLKGIDIRRHGSGNVGATNVFRAVGKGPGAAVLLIDIVKGVLPLVAVASALGLEAPRDLVLVALSAVCGHNWTVFLRFRGGKGIATSLGVLIGLAVKLPGIVPVLLFTVAAWAASFLITRIVSLSSMIAAVALPVLMVLFPQPGEILALGVIFSLFVVWRHKSNILRLVRGEEPRVPLFKK